MLQNSRIQHRKKPCNKNDSPVENNGYEPEIKNKAAFHSPAGAWVIPAPSSKKPEEREFVEDSAASMHILCKKMYAQRNPDGEEALQLGVCNLWRKV